MSEQDNDLILASGSASRKAMLEAAGVPFRAVPAAIDERAVEAEGGGSFSNRALGLAKAKALAVSREHEGRLVLGSDSLCVVDERRFDKPRSRAEAAEHLRFFSGKAIELHSAAALSRGSQIVWHTVERAYLEVRSLSEAFIEDYLDHEWPEISHCAGAFRIEARGVTLFDAIEGSQFTVLGMPLLPVLEALRDHGVIER